MRAECLSWFERRVNSCSCLIAAIIIIIIVVVVVVVAVVAAAAAAACCWLMVCVFLTSRMLISTSGRLRTDWRLAVGAPFVGFEPLYEGARAHAQPPLCWFTAASGVRRGAQRRLEWPLFIQRIRALATLRTGTKQWARRRRSANTARAHLAPARRAGESRLGAGRRRALNRIPGQLLKRWRSFVHY